MSTTEPSTSPTAAGSGASADGAWVDDDVARATKPELILRPVADGEGGLAQRYDFVLERA